MRIKTPIKKECNGTVKEYSLSYYRRSKIADRIIGSYMRADGDTIKDGRNWYLKANMFCKELAANYDMDTDVVSQVVSALSPSVLWELNKLQAHQMIAAWKGGLSLEDVTVSTYDGNKEKAWAILNGEKVMEPKSLKTYAFYKNMLLDPEHVTIDRWIIRALFSYPPKSITKKRYEEIAEIFVTIADSIGIEPFELQAIVWLQTMKEA